MHTVSLTYCVSRHTERTVAEAVNVPDCELVSCFRKFADYANEHCLMHPTVWVDGKGYTQTRDFLDLVRTVNDCSMAQGGAPIYSLV